MSLRRTKDEAIGQRLVDRAQRPERTKQARAARLPDLPTLAESGVPGVEAAAWFAPFCAGEDAGCNN